MVPVDINNKKGDFPVEYLVPVDQRARVHTGQFLGRVSHSGNSSGPHLHTHVQKIADDEAGDLEAAERGDGIVYKNEHFTGMDLGIFQWN